MKPVRRVTLGTTVVLACLMVGCAPKRPPPPPPVVIIPPPPSVRPDAALSPARYVAVAASNALLSLRSAELAGQRAASSGLRAFAAQSASSHRGIAAQLNFAGRRLDLLPEATLLATDQALYDQLAASGDFDRSYRRQQAIVLARAIAVHSAFARSGTSPTLRPVARMAEPVVRQELEMLRGL